MNFGGINFFYAFGFLLLFFGIVYVYGIIIYVLISKVRSWFQKDRTFSQLFNFKGVINLGLLLFIALCVAYFNQRIKWMGDDNKYYEAKEYFVVGRIASAPRKILPKLIHPELIIFKPFVLLQKWIYDLGVQHLPEDDGERFYWYNSWFLEPYTTPAFHVPRGVSTREHSPKMVPLLDSYWSTIEGLMNHPFGDSQIEKAVLLGTPATIHYYALYQGYYMDVLFKSGAKLRNHPLYRARNKQMLVWLDELESRWQENNLSKVIWEKYPQITSIHQLTVNDLTQSLVLSLPLAGEFSCDHSLMRRLLHEFEVSMSADPQVSPFVNLSKTNKKTAQKSYQLAVYYATGSAGNYLLTKVCGKTMLKEKYKLVDKIGIYNEFYGTRSVKRIFSKELQAL